MNDGVRVLTSAAELAEAGWDDLLQPGDYYLSTEWLRAIEQGEGAAASYPTVWRGGELVGGVTTHPLDAKSSPFFRVDVLLAEHAPSSSLVGANDPLLPVLTCGGRHLGTSKVPVRADLSPAERREVLDALLGSLTEQAGESNAAATAFLAVDSADTPLLDALDAAGYVGFPSAVHSILRLPPEGFEAYVQGLDKRGRRYVRTDMRKVAAAGYTFEVRELNEELAHTIAPLESSLNEKYDGVTATAELAYRHLRYLEWLPRGMKVLLALSPEGAVHGSITFLDWRGCLFVRTWGKHPTVPENFPLYFSTVYYELIKWAYSNGYHTIDHVTHQEEVKRSRGCTQTHKFAALHGVAAAVHQQLTREFPHLVSAVRQENNHD
ncbi:peptidogalycan biosysnthesis protein [Kribbella sp. NPDC051620]|uniref:peptidogalycan biosysnthesis protein n=1 Tax=Kribbella sp. NPDC051620 TaxID=3364120 RepID=UPI00378ABE47